MFLGVCHGSHKYDINDNKLYWQNISFERKKRGQLYMHVWIKPTMQRSKICFGSSSSPFASHVDLQSVCLILNYKASLVRMVQGARDELDMWISIITYLRFFSESSSLFASRSPIYLLDSLLWKCPWWDWLEEPKLN